MSGWSVTLFTQTSQPFADQRGFEFYDRLLMPLTEGERETYADVQFWEQHHGLALYEFPAGAKAAKRNIRVCPGASV